MVHGHHFRMLVQALAMALPEWTDFRGLADKALEDKDWALGTG